MKIPKHYFEEIIDATRDRFAYVDYDEECYETICREGAFLESYTGVSFAFWRDFFESILHFDEGINPEVTNEQIYEILKILGLEVVDE